VKFRKVGGGEWKWLRYMSSCGLWYSGVKTFGYATESWLVNI